MTIVDTAPPQRATKAAHRPYRVRVARIRRLAPSFVRITFTGPDLGDFGVDGLDQRIKVVLPLAATAYETFPIDGPDAAEWYSIWRGLPPHEQNVFRTYTARAVRPDEREVDVDFVCHGDTGPASAWAGAAEVGDEIVLVGPDATSGVTGSGVEWAPGDARTLLLAGDETAAPAICSIVEQLPADARGCVFIEVPTPADELDLTAPAGVDVYWLPRSTPGAGHGDALVVAVRRWTARYLTAWHHGVEVSDVDIDHDILWDVPQGDERHGASVDGDLYAWFAGEAGAIKTLRRFLVSEVGIDRHQVAFMGYWRVGKSES